MKLIAHLTAATVIAIWGTTFVCTKVLLQAGLLPSDIFFYRFLIAYVLMWPFTWRHGFARSFCDELVMLGMGVMGGSLYFLTENWALQFSVASNVSILVSTCPLITAVVMAVRYKDERLSWKQSAGTLIAFVGAVLVIMNGQMVLHLNPQGDVLAVAAALTWTIYSLLMKRVAANYPVHMITRKVFGYGLLSIIPYCVISQPLNTDFALLAKLDICGLLLFLAVIASLACYLLWNWVMRLLGTVKATNYIYMQSPFTMLFAALVLGEQITLMAVGGLALIIVGMIRVQKR